MCWRWGANHIHHCQSPVSPVYANPLSKSSSQLRDDFSSLSVGGKIALSTAGGDVSTIAVRRLWRSLLVAVLVILSGSVVS